MCARDVGKAMECIVRTYHRYAYYIRYGCKLVVYRTLYTNNIVSDILGGHPAL